MSTEEYLQQVLQDQTLDPDGSEMKAVESHREKVEGVIAKAFPESSPNIRYGGSKAKGTMIKEAYDLDVICYFPHEDTEPGDSLKEIYENVKRSLEEDYFVEPRRSSLRLRGNQPTDFKVTLHVDVVPGRYVDSTKSDAYLHQNYSEKKWLRTNLQVHIDHIRDSGVREAIRLVKLWRVRNGIDFKTFVLELAVIKLLGGHKDKSLEEQLLHVWQSFRDEIGSLTVEDPANSNNDLSPRLDAVRSLLAATSGSTLATIDSQGWEAVFGKVSTEDDDTSEKLSRAAAVVRAPTKPWAR